MSLREERSNLRAPFWRMLARKDVLAGLLFIAVAVLGLWISRDYPIGTALRMGTGYVPRLLCWLLFGLGVIVLVQGLREAQDARALSSDDVSALRPLSWAIRRPSSSTNRRMGWTPKVSSGSGSWPATSPPKAGPCSCPRT